MAAPTTDAPRETMARLRHLRTSPTKVRPVLKLIVGHSVLDARDTLLLCERGVADDVSNLLDSAVANAEHNDNVPEDELKIVRAFADEGPTAKRWRPRARGRGTRIRKRTSHITIVVGRYGDDELERRRAVEAVSARPVRRRPTRRRAVEAEHEHEHDHDDESVDDPTAEPAAEKSTAKKAAKKSATKKSTAKKTAKRSTKATTKKSTAKKAAKKSTAKKSTKSKSDAKDEDA